MRIRQRGFESPKIRGLTIFVLYVLQHFPVLGALIRDSFETRAALIRPQSRWALPYADFVSDSGENGVARRIRICGIQGVVFFLVEA